MKYKWSCGIFCPTWENHSRFGRVDLCYLVSLSSSGSIQQNHFWLSVTVMMRMTRQSWGNIMGQFQSPVKQLYISIVLMMTVRFLHFNRYIVRIEPFMTVQRNVCDFKLFKLTTNLTTVSKVMSIQHFFRALWSSLNLSVDFLDGDRWSRVGQHHRSGSQW